MTLVKRKQPSDILSEVFSQHSPSIVLCSYSGGYDSAIAGNEAFNWHAKNNIQVPIKVISVDTQLSADGWKDYVQSTSMQLWGQDVEFWQSAYFKKWVEGVEKCGFGYNRDIHTIFFRRLKAKAFSDIVAHYKQHLHDRVMFVTGMRRDESPQRANTPEWARRGSTLWCNPIVYLNKQEIFTYRIENELPVNPFYDYRMGSGDCLCNWHTSVNLNDLRLHARTALKIIEPLDAKIRPLFGYGYGEKPSVYLKQEIAGQMPLFDDIPNLCASCRFENENDEAGSEIMLQRMEW